MVKQSCTLQHLSIQRESTEHLPPLHSVCVCMCVCVRVCMSVWWGGSVGDWGYKSQVFSCLHTCVQNWKTPCFPLIFMHLIVQNHKDYNNKVCAVTKLLLLILSPFNFNKETWNPLSHALMIFNYVWMHIQKESRNHSQYSNPLEYFMAADRLSKHHKVISNTLKMNYLSFAGDLQS